MNRNGSAAGAILSLAIAAVALTGCGGGEAAGPEDATPRLTHLGTDHGFSDWIVEPAVFNDPSESEVVCSGDDVNPTCVETTTQRSGITGGTYGFDADGDKEFDAILTAEVELLSAVTDFGNGTLDYEWRVVNLGTGAVTGVQCGPNGPAFAISAPRGRRPPAPPAPQRARGGGHTMKGPAPLLVVAFATVALAGCASVTAPDEGAFCSATADARPPDLSVAALAHHPGTALASATVRASCPAPTNAINLLSAILQKLASGGPQEVGPYPVEDFHTPREKEQFVDEIETLLGVFQNSDAAAYCAAITSLQDRLDLFLKPNSRGLVNMERDLAHVKSQAGCG